MKKCSYARVLTSLIIIQNILKNNNYLTPSSFPPALIYTDIKHLFQHIHFEHYQYQTSSLDYTTQQYLYMYFGYTNTILLPHFMFPILPNLWLSTSNQLDFSLLISYHFHMMQHQISLHIVSISSDTLIWFWALTIIENHY